MSKEQRVQDCPDMLQNWMSSVGKNVQKSPKGKKSKKPLAKSPLQAVMVAKSGDAGTDYSG